MSRIIVSAHGDGSEKIVVGWDRPLHVIVNLGDDR
jgi:hypothetical protein